MKIPTHQELIDFVNQYLRESDEKPSSFGRRVLGDSGAIPRLASTDPRLSTVQKIVTAIKNGKYSAYETDDRQERSEGR